MLKHRVQTTVVSSAPPGGANYPVTQQNAQPGIENYPDIQIQTSSGETYPGNMCDTAPYGDYRGTQSAQLSSHHTAPVVNNTPYITQQMVKGQGYRSFQNQQLSPDTSPDHVINNRDYTATSAEQSSCFNSQDITQPSSDQQQDSKEGVRIITQKYDSPSKFSTSPQKSPMGSPSSDGGTFSFTDMIMSKKFREGVTEQDLLQVDTFYRSHKSEVYVCGCLVNMYFGSAKAALNNDEWTFSRTGIPLLLLDTGEHHRERKLYIILAEKGTGFTIWRDVVDNQTGYRTPNANFHTMHTSTDYSKLAGFSFDDAGAASEFYGHLHKLTADPDDQLLNPGNIKKKKSIKDKKKKVKLPKKTEISQPCCFVHVTKLDRPISEDSETTSSNKSSNSNEISAPFNFQHMTGPSKTGCDVSNLMGSKLTLTSTSSVDSGLSEDRGSSKTGN